MRRSIGTVLLWSVAVVAAAVIGISWFGPSRDYLYVPNQATPVASKVTVEGEKVHAPARTRGAGGLGAALMRGTPPR